MKNLKYYLILTFIFISVWILSSNIKLYSKILNTFPIITLDDTFSKIIIPNTFFLDESGKIPIDEINKSSFNIKFPRSNNTNSIVWLKFLLINNSTKGNEWKLNIPLFQSKAKVYILESNKIIFMDSLSMFSPINKRCVISISNLSRGTQTVLIALTRAITNINLGTLHQGLGGFNVNQQMRQLSLFTKSAYEQTKDDIYLDELWKVALLHICWGILISLFIYNLFVAFTIKETAYYYYLLYIATIIVQSGFPTSSILFDSFNFQVWDQSIILFGSIALVFGILFAMAFLNIKNIMPKIYRFLYIFNFFWILYVIFNEIIYRFPTPLIGWVLALTVMCILFVAAIIAKKKNVPSAKYFLIAWSWLIAGVLVSSFCAIINTLFLDNIADFNVITYKIISYRPILIGACFEMLFLSIALANRIKLQREELAKKHQDLAVAEKEKELEHIKNVELEALNNEIHEQATKIQLSNTELNEAYISLQDSQAQLIQSEKMAAFGRLAAGVAHEINTPLGAIRASAGNIDAAINDTLKHFPEVIKSLSPEEEILFVKLLKSSNGNNNLLSAKDQRVLRKSFADELESVDIQDADSIADTLLDIGIRKDILNFLPLIRKENYEEILQAAYSMSGMKRNAFTISTAVNRASKIVFALKSYSREHDYTEKEELDVIDNIETVLTLYHNQLKQNIDIIKDYEENIPKIMGYPDELYQVWTNIIHNALQAMENKGTLKIVIKTNERKDIEVSFSDTGGGIPEDILPRIFEPFFTTKSVGEGTGLGLDICKKIVEKHGGEIKIENVTHGAEVKINLPINNL